MTTSHVDAQKRTAANTAFTIMMGLLIILQPVTIFYLKNSAEKLEQVYETSIKTSVRLEFIEKDFNTRLINLETRVLKTREKLDDVTERLSKVESQR
ncbi:TPA: hypothetical protein ACPDKP_000795 [Pasteurella multocida]|nr:hypothetical protein [Pasteurella multocida]